MIRLLTLIFLLFASQPVFAETWHVGTNGSNANCNSGTGSIKLTIAFALACVGAAGTTDGAGDTVEVGDGTYNESLVDLIPSGTVGNPFTLKATNARAAILRPSSLPSTYGIISINSPTTYRYITVDGLVLDGALVTGDTPSGIYGIRMSSATGAEFSNVTIKNTEIKNIRRIGIFAMGDAHLFTGNYIHNGGEAGLTHAIYTSTTNSIYELNELSHWTAFGFHFYNSFGCPGIGGNIVRRNIVHHMADAALLACGQNMLAYNNIFYLNGTGVSGNQGGSGAGIYNNTIYQNTTYGVQNAFATGFVLQNNIIYQNGTDVSLTAGGETNTNNLTTNPSFVNAAAFDFHLQSGSAAINAGTTIASVTTDFDGTPRPQGAAYDIGSFERLEATSLSVAAAAMSAGSWATLTTSNTSVLRVGSSTSSMTPFSMSAAWDSTARKVHYIGMDHGYTNLRHVNYEEAANSWALLSEPSLLGRAHGYEHLAINKFTGDIYHRQYDLGNVFNISRYSGGTWSAWSTNIDCGYEQVAVGTGFWSGTLTGATDGVGAYVIYSSGQTNGMVCFVNPATGAVFASVTGFGGTSTYHSFFEYSPVKNVAIFGGGNDNPRKVWRLNADRTVTALTDSPVDLGIQRGSVAADPVTGNFLILHGGNLYELDPDGSGSYSIQTGARVPPSSVGNPASPALANMFVVPIDTYNVVMYVTCTSSACSVNLYKHASGGGSSDVTQPVVNITSPTTGSTFTTFGTTVNLEGTASDNVGGWWITQVTWSCNVCGSGTATGTTSWAITAIPLVIGSNAITVSARDGAGNVGTRTLTVIRITPPASNFTTRCNAAGVIKCNGFDTDAQINGTWGVNPHGAFANQGQPRIPVRDTNVWSSGGGSLKCLLLPGEGGNACGQFYQNFSDNLQTQFGQNETFFVQFRMRIDTNFHNALKGFAGAKQMIMGVGSRVGTPAGSCTQLELVLQNNVSTYGPAGIPQMYHHCGDYGAIGNYPIASQWNSFDTAVQNARGNVPGCWYYNPTYASRLAPNGNCFPYYENEWMTFKFRVDIGPRQFVSGFNCNGGVGGQWCFVNSRVRMWIARDGQASEAVIDKVMNLHSDNPDDKYGQVWFLPYSGDNTFPNGGTIWYDELLISTTEPADPGVSESDTIAPVVTITGPTTATTFSTLNNFVTVSGTCTDNVACSAVNWSNDRGGSGTATGTASWTASAIPLLPDVNVITVTALDAAANPHIDTITVTYSPSGAVVLKLPAAPTGLKFGKDAPPKLGTQ